MKQMLFSLALLMVVQSAHAQSVSADDVRRPWIVLNSSFGIGASVSRLYADFGLNGGGGRIPLVVPELEFNVWYAYVAIGAWRHKVESLYPGVDEKVGTSLWKLGPLLRVGAPNRCVTLVPYLGAVGCFSSWDVGTETIAARNHRKGRFLFGVRVGLTRKCFECALHVSNSECGLNVMLKIDEDD